MTGKNTMATAHRPFASPEMSDLAARSESVNTHSITMGMNIKSRKKNSQNDTRSSESSLVRFIVPNGRAQVINSFTFRLVLPKKR